MTVNEGMREAIARAIYESEGHPHPSPYLNQADAVLAVLADPPADVLDRATAALAEWDGVDAAVASGTVTQDGYRNGARRALEAAFGGEQNG